MNTVSGPPPVEPARRLSATPRAAAIVVSVALGVVLAGVSVVLAGCGKKTSVRPPELVAPKTVAQLSLASKSEGVELHWSRPTETVDGKTMEDLGGFVIERAVSPAGFREIARVPVTDRGRFQKEKRFEYFDRSVIPDGTYHYRVVAFTSDQYYSAPSGVATITWTPKAASPSSTATPAATSSARPKRSK